ncbi:hypothetical protein ALC62_07743 [Cyphomyrmex costatus]|uniref:Uncharacterized protein n=1 Tax=Cyphomyrmex costatus TaxID=456900 RepID=A0A195CLG5_9HYME|nr:hypothetical protein ALC62_07743 [Cyphomyrmex costatus]
MKEKTGSTVYKRKWGRAMQQKLLLEGKEGGTLEKEETLKRLKLPQILECSFKRQVPVNYDL